MSANPEMSMSRRLPFLLGFLAWCHPRGVAKFSFGFAIAFLAAACGGVARGGHEAEAGAGGGASGSGGATNGGATAGGATGGRPTGGGATGIGAAGAGTAGVAAESPADGFDDVFPWIDGTGNIVLPTSGIDRLLQMAVTDAPARATLSTHNIFDLLSDTSSLRFSARASAPFRLVVSVGHVMPSYDYFASRDAGDHWPEASVLVDLEWREFNVPFTDMAPPERADYVGMKSFYIAFVVESQAPIDVWIDDVRLE